MSLTIEPARSEDAPAVLAIQRAVLGEGRWFISRPHEIGGIDATVRLIRECGRHPTSRFLVARQDGVIVGFLAVRGGSLERMRHTGKLEIMVSAAARGTGVGRALMQACLDWASANPALEKLGLSVFADNEAAIALYRRFGFEQEGHRVAEYKLEDGTYRDDLLMFRRFPR